MSAPATDEPAGAAETHISRLFFAGDRVYKLLKPVELGFLDFSDRATRLAAAKREFELNRRFAPDVYLGLGDIREGDEVVDHVIVMARMPEDRRLSKLLGRPRIADCVRSVARCIAAHHAGQPPIEDAPGATRDAVAANWSDNFEVTEQLGSELIAAEECRSVRYLANRYLEGRERLFARRLADGFVREGHGDLIADDIYCLDDGPRILDCLAFRDDFRIGDVLADIGFLAMDLDRLGHPELSRRVMHDYQEFSGEQHPSSLAHHYIAYRAHVRAKVACLAHAQGQPDQAELARTYHRLAHEHLRRGAVKVVLVGGAPGVGKSTVAEHLSRRFGFYVLATDEIRKDLAGLGHTARASAPVDDGLYRPERVAQTYDEMLRQAESLLRSGCSVLLDASWSSAEQRTGARRLADLTSADLVEVECTAEPAVGEQRIRGRLERGASSSDVTPEILAELRARRDPWPEALQLSTEGTESQTEADAVSVLEAVLGWAAPSLASQL